MQHWGMTLNRFLSVKNSVLYLGFASLFIRLPNNTIIAVVQGETSDEGVAFSLSAYTANLHQTGEVDLEKLGSLLPETRIIETPSVL